MGYGGWCMGFNRQSPVDFHAEVVGEALDEGDLAGVKDAIGVGEVGEVVEEAELLALPQALADGLDGRLDHCHAVVAHVDAHRLGDEAVEVLVGEGGKPRAQMAARPLGFHRGEVGVGAVGEGEVHEGDVVRERPAAGRCGEGHSGRGRQEEPRPGEAEGVATAADTGGRAKAERKCGPEWKPPAARTLPRAASPRKAPCPTRPPLTSALRPPPMPPLSFNTVFPTALTDAIAVTYHVTSPPGVPVDAFADALLLEQTIETPRSVAARHPFVERHLSGTVEAIDDVGDGMSRVRLRLPSYTAASDPAQLLNVVFGNASIHPGVTLVGVDVPASVLDAGGYGPSFGADGLRRLCGDPPRPLVASALKPAGLTAPELADVAYRLALGGLDVLKDDHYLASQPTAPLAERVVSVVGALDAAAQRTGRRTRYAPNVSGTPDAVLARAEQAVALGADALLVAPMLVGLPTLHALKRFGVPLLAHPAFSGASRVAPDVMIGQLFRLFGADAVVFAGHGGRFAISLDDVRAIVAAAARPMHGLRAALPTPAGGMTRERATELVGIYGIHAMLLVGGSLLDAPDLTAAARDLVTAAEAASADVPTALA